MIGDKGNYKYSYLIITLITMSHDPLCMTLARPQPKGHFHPIRQRLSCPSRCCRESLAISCSKRPRDDLIVVTARVVYYYIVKPLSVVPCTSFGRVQRFFGRESNAAGRSRPGNDNKVEPTGEILCSVSRGSCAGSGIQRSGSLNPKNPTLCILTEKPLARNPTS